MSCRCFWSFHAHFSRQAESLLESLDAQKQKLLRGELSNSSSSSSIGGSVSSAPATAAARMLRSAPTSSAASKQRTRSTDRTEMLYG